LGFALGLYSANRLQFGISAFILGTAAAWLGWELLLGKAAPSARRDVSAMAYGISTGLGFPAVGLALAALTTWLQP
jgi:hypothetical protein